jgi:adenine-specific DNA-methyltransferase
MVRDISAEHPSGKLEGSGTSASSEASAGSGALFSRIPLINKIRASQKEMRYGLIWEDKTEEFELLTAEKLPVLKHIPEYDIVSSDDSEDSEDRCNILIEGDNYHALVCLNQTYPNQIDLIYIDPPYNTGSRDFIYKDRYVEKEDEYSHSRWLSFMYKRLMACRELLKSDGVIFISINEEELSQLKLLCDEVFGPENYMTMFTVKVRHEERILKMDKDFHEVVEYLLMYRKSDQHKTVKRKRDNTSNDLYVYEIEELAAPSVTMKCGDKTVQVFRPGEYRIIRRQPDVRLFKKICIRGSIKEGNSSGRFYMQYLSALQEEKRGCLIKVPDIGNDSHGYRYFLMPSSSSKVNGDYFQGVPLNRKETIELPYPNYLDFVREFNTAGYEGGVDFRGKKPVSFLLKVFELGGMNEKKDGVVLDFFAGSGSTGEAVLELNKADGGKRRFILCTNNESNICYDITLPRLKNVIQGYPARVTQDTILLDRQLTYSDLAKMDRILAKISGIEEENRCRYETVLKTVADNRIRVIGRCIKSRKEGLGGSLKFYKTAFTE